MSFIGKPTTYLPFGAVKINSFPKPVPCTTNTEFCQPTEQTDDIEFQFLASESEELLVNGNFANGTNNWIALGWAALGVLNSVDPNKQACQLTTSAFNGIYQTGVITLGDFYRITITVRNRTTGAVSIAQGTSIFQTANVFVSSNGTFTLFLAAQGTGNDFSIVGTTDFDGCVDDVSLIRVSDITDYTIQIHDQETLALIDTVAAANLRQTGNVITVKFNWANDVTVSNGCRILRIFDTTKLLDDNFSTNQGWLLGADVVIALGVMRYVNAASLCFVPSGFDCGAIINNVLVVGEQYTVTYSVKNSAGASVAIFAGSTQGTTRNSNGTFVETLTCTVSGSVQFNFFGTLGQSIEVDDVFIEKFNDLDGESECYDLQTLHDCSLLLRWSNNESWGGFDYSTDTDLLGGGGVSLDPFEHRLRIIAKFRGSKYPSTKIIGEDSAGGKTLDYSTMRKARILDVDFAPEYMHDAIAAFFEQDTRLINDESFTLLDEYEPSAPNDSRVIFKDLMTSRSELEPTLQPNQINRNE